MKTTSLQEQRKEYYVKNRHRILEKSAQYYAENKKQVLERMAETHKQNPVPGREKAKRFAQKNPDKLKKYQETWKERHPEKRKLYTRNSRIRAYGIEPEIYYKMLEEQGHGCAICNKKSIKRMLSIDHSHDTGKVRGLLCDSCNLSLGHLERGEWLTKATQYLIQYK